jgi:DNA-binding NtrC family response regulator
MQFFRCLFGRDLAAGEAWRPRPRSRRAIDLVRAFASVAHSWPSGLAGESAAARRSALIISGDAAQRRFCETFLRALGLRVDVATTAAQALAALREDTFGLVIVDVAVAGLDGDFWTRLFEVLMSSELARPPHLYLVADDDGAHASIFRNLGAHRSISRPVRAVALVEAIERLGG